MQKYLRDSYSKSAQANVLIIGKSLKDDTKYQIWLFKSNDHKSFKDPYSPVPPNI